MIAEIERRPPPGPVLLAGRNLDPVHRALEGAGVGVTRWKRWAEPGRDTTEPRAWPREGSFASAILRLPRGKEELEMEAHALLARLAPGGALLLFGARDEGVVSAPRRLEPLVGAKGAVTTLAVKARCRVVEIRPGSGASAPRGTLPDWIRESSTVIGAERRPWVSYPGLFAGGELDAGTALLLRSLPRIAPGSRVLDFGCGTGVIGAEVLAVEPDARVDMLDADALALEAVRANVPGSRILPAAFDLGGSDGPYDWILSNPPFHEAKGETLKVLEDLVSEAPRVLSRKGGLVFVTQRRLPVEGLLKEAFRTVAILDQDPVFRVWSGTGATLRP
jgi:16S rRNA (guanine1207-N2)-methyltransferase